MEKITYANIEAERLKHGLSKKELSQAIGVPPSYGIDPGSG